MAMDGGVLAMASGRQGSAGREKPNMPHSTYLPHCMGSAGIVGRWCDVAARAAAVIAGAMGDRAVLAVLPESASDGCGGRCRAVASPAVSGWAGARAFGGSGGVAFKGRGGCGGCRAMGKINYRVD